MLQDVVGLIVSRGRVCCYFFFSSRRRHTRCSHDWSSDVCSSDLGRSTAVALPDTPPSASIHWAVVAGDTEIASGTAGSAAWRLPDDLPVGTFRLDVEVKSRAGRASEGAGLLVAPERAYGGEDFADGRGVWA